MNNHGFDDMDNGGDKSTSVKQRGSTSIKNNNNNPGEEEQTKNVGLKRTVGLSAGISIIIGNMIGSGIFVSPKSVLSASNSIGLCLIIWVLCGVVSLLGKLKLLFCLLDSIYNIVFYVK
jgi:hypothetical protein